MNSFNILCERTCFIFIENQKFVWKKYSKPPRSIFHRKIKGKKKVSVTFKPYFQSIATIQLGYQESSS